MKKFLSALIIMISLASCALAEENAKVGVLAQLNMTEDEYKKFVIDDREKIGWNFLSHSNENFRYYDSLMALQLALNVGEIDEIILPEVVGEYFVNSNPSAYQVSGVTYGRVTFLAFGFLAHNNELRDKFNKAIKELKEDGTLEKLLVRYTESFKEGTEKPAKHEKFSRAEKIRIALTGDLPPIDFIAPDGTPAGFNMAIIAELENRLKADIEVMDIESGARSAALASGRADASFWYKGTKDVEVQPDIPEKIILSDSYYEWNKYLHIKKKK